MADTENRAFVQSMLQENLSHARHVENERMSLAMGMTGLVSGLWAIGGTAITEGIAEDKCGQIAVMMVICVIVLIAITVAAKQTGRWNDIFTDHWNQAEKCYKMLDPAEVNDQLFPFHYPRCEIKGDTKQKFKKLYRILQASMVILFVALTVSLYVIRLPNITPAG